MILTGPAIEVAHSAREIIIDPFSSDNLNPNSYDFRLGDRCRTYDAAVLDSVVDNPSSVQIIPATGILLQPDRIYLFNTVERIGSSVYVPIIRARSSIARLGLFIHITADLIDLGSINQLTLQLHAIAPVRVYPGMRIGQVTFWCTVGAPTLYSGKYRDLESPAASLSFKDFHERHSQ